ncbi:MAG: hypothetical protein AAFV28_07885 [Cyanobacteria bacterium J06635_13]
MSFTDSVTGVLIADSTNGNQVLAIVDHVTVAEITADDFVSMDI